MKATVRIMLVLVLCTFSFDLGVLASATVGADTARATETAHSRTQSPYVAPTVGADTVPSALHCAEDDVIGYVPVQPAPYGLGCVHNEGGMLAGTNATSWACRTARQTFRFEHWQTRIDRARAAEIVSAVCYP